MTFIWALFSDATAYLQWPVGLLGWLWFVLFFVGLVIISWFWRNYQKSLNLSFWLLLFGLFIVAPFATLFIGIRLPAEGALPPPGLLLLPVGPVWMIFSGVTFVIAAGFLGPFPSLGLAAISGFLIAIWDTHTPFTILEYALIGLIVGVAANQWYRTPFYRLIRHPLVISILVMLGYPAIFILDTLFVVGGDLAVSLDFALTRVATASIAVGGVLLVGSLVGEVFVFGLSDYWGRKRTLEPSPAERSLETRSFYIIVPAVVILMIALTIFSWVISGNTARRLIRDRMEGTAKMAVESVPFALEVGQNLIIQIASDPILADVSERNLSDTLLGQLRLSPYFQQLLVVDSETEVLATVPEGNSVDANLFPEEQVGIDLAFQGVTFQYYSIPPSLNGSSARISFIAAVSEPGGDINRVLVGRSDLGSNPFTAPILKSLDDMGEMGGIGVLLDEEGRILYHPQPTLVMSPFGESFDEYVSDEPAFFDTTGSEGTRRLVFYQPAIGRPWSVVVTVPAQEVQRLAINTAAPLFGLLLVLSVLLILVLRVVLRFITGSLRRLAVEANRIARDQRELGTPLKISSVDEVGQMRYAFEKMRSSLKARLDEQEQLLIVSHGVASSLEVHESIKPILEAAITTGAVSARIVLSTAKVDIPELEDSQAYFGLGSLTDHFGELDPQILSLTQSQSQVILTNPARARLLSINLNNPNPESLIAFGLQHENTRFGAFWVAYDQPHQFHENEIRFLSTLAGQAALAVSNAQLFMSAEIGRQRLASILASTPVPVLVTDYKNRLLLANPVAWQIFGDGLEPVQGAPIEQVISNKDVTKLLTRNNHQPKNERELETKSPFGDYESKEIVLSDGRVFYATASSIVADDKLVGRVCVLRDVTQFKELDALKSEFVSTVSHDLRSPLTLIHGYATMLQMVGELNAQQTNYVKKIIKGVEGMNNLVNNLLDLGRIEAGVGLRVEMVPIIDIVEQVIDTLQLQAAQKQINLKFERPSDENPLVEADQALVQQALQNLIENGIKYTDSGGNVTITVKIRKEEERVRIEVKDTGIGISPVDQPRLFERFYRAAKRESRKQRGSGLGLSIVKSIVERHGGKVWVDSQLGKGSVFYLELPIRQSIVKV